MRKKRVELVERVVIAARSFVDDGDACPLLDAVWALNAYEAAEITGAGARWVEGSPETSQEAAALAAPVQGSARYEIVALLAHVQRMCEPGYTDEQLEARLKRPHTTVSSARNWLVEAGWVRDSGERRKTHSGRRAVVWELTEAARKRLANGLEIKETT